MQATRFAVLLGLVAMAVGCGGEPVEITPGLTAFVGARIIDGTGDAPIEDGVLVVRDGRIEAVGAVDIPPDAEQIDVTGRTIMPGMINAHGHVNNVRGLGTVDFTEEQVEYQLGLYARYGVTTVFSLGGDGPESMAVRDRQNTPDLDRARLFVAGNIATGPTPEAAIEQVNAVADSGADIVKVRVDNNLNPERTQKMTPETYQAVIDTAHQRGLRVAAHLYYLEDATGLLEAGADLLAHSVRDLEVDDTLITLLRDSGVCYCPTLMREVSTFVYESRPDWFDDPFFTKETGPEVIAALDSELWRDRSSSRTAQIYKTQLEVAKRNVKTLSDAGIPIAMGTDTGPTARFQGYFEHGELALMVEAGLTPMQAIVASTSDAASCMEVDTDLGSLETGKWADFLVLGDNPLDDIGNTKTLETVYIAGNPVPEA